MAVRFGEGGGCELGLFIDKHSDFEDFFFEK